MQSDQNFTEIFLYIKFLLHFLPFWLFSKILGVGQYGIHGKKAGDSTAKAGCKAEYSDIFKVMKIENIAILLHILNLFVH